MLRDRLAHLGIDARVSSAGTISEGRPASEHSVALLAERATDLSAFRSSLMSADRLAAADLVLGMARSHVREAVVMVPAVWPRTFTLKELVRRGTAIGPRRVGEPVEAWLAQAHAGRALSATLGDSPDDDVEDPIGRPRRAYEAMVSELHDLTGRLVALLWPQAPRPGEAAEPGGRAGQPHH